MEMKGKLQDIVNKNVIGYKDFEINTFRAYKHYGVGIEPKYLGEKRVLADALLNRNQEINEQRSFGLNQESFR
jgi:hypothetical protein